MKVALITWGSTGDVQPFLALAQRLVVEGHAVRALASDFYEARFRAVGADFFSVGPSWNNPEYEAMFQGLMDTLVQTKNPIRSARLILEKGYLYDAQQRFEDYQRGLDDMDIAVCHSIDIAGQMALDKKGVPWASTLFCPGSLPTAYEPPDSLPNLGRWGNRQLWKIARWMLRRQLDPLFDNFLRRNGMKPRPNYFQQSLYSPDLNMMPVSPELCPPHPDYGPGHHILGHWVLQEPATPVPDVLQAFLRAGEPPVVVSFGSMGGTRPELTTRIILEALKLAGVRGVIQSGFGKLGGEAGASDTVHFADYVPHDALFSHALCVVHHGGCGTSHAACRAGVPSVVVAHLADQPYWGSCLRRAGVAPKHLFRKDMTAARLVAKIRDVRDSRGMQERARHVGERMRKERGLDEAVKLLKGFAALHRRLG